mgnify:FL=1
MLVYLAGLIFAILILVCLFVSLRIFLSKGWFKAWLKGNLAMFFLALMLLLVIAGHDLFSYRASLHGEQLAVIKLQQQAYQLFNLEITWPDGSLEGYQVRGDQWQLDARLIIWSGWFEKLGFDAVHRFDRISGRYFTVEDELNKARSVFTIHQSNGLIDVWGFLNKNAWIPGVGAKYGAGVYMPMSDEAIFGVYVRNNALLSLPLNNKAKLVTRNN